MSKLVPTEMTTTTFQLPTKLHHNLKIALAQNNQSMADILRDMIEQYIEHTNGKIK